MAESEEPSSRQHLKHLLSQLTEAKPHKLVLPQNIFNIIVKVLLICYKNALAIFRKQRLRQLFI